MPNIGSLVLLILILVLFGVGALLWLLKRLLDSKQGEVQGMVDQIFGASADKIAKQAHQLLSSEREVIKTDLENKHREMARLVKDLETVVDSRQKELQILEKERATQFGSLVKQLSEQQRVTDKLSSTTQALAQVLSSNQGRGNFGERLIEDMLTASGLRQGEHYLLQSKLGNTEVKPDVTLLLPNHRVVPVDVKFPFAALQQWAEVEDTQSKQAYLKQFRADVKKHIDKVAEYILPEEGTLDYVVIFVPNEAVFSFLNQKLADLLDYSIGKRVLVTSPFTFLIVARTIMESYRNFLLGDRLKGVLGQIEGFIGEWSKYQESLGKFGRAIDSLKSSYEELTTTRFRQLDKKVQKVRQLGQGVLQDPDQLTASTSQKTLDLD